jgi:PAS domain S-box-containing protein
LIFSSDELKQLAFNYASDGMFVHELLDGGRPGTFIEVNDYGCRMTGYSREDLLELTPMDIDRMPPEKARVEMEKLFQNGQNTFESILVTKSGVEIPIEISNYVVSKDKKNIIVAIVRDITERKKNEEALQRSEEKYRNLFESATDIIFILDLDGNFIDVNHTALTKLGYTKDEMRSLHISQFDPPEYAARVPERLAQIKDKGVTVFESANLRKDGTVMPVEVHSRLIEYEGRQVVFSIVRDITERKQTDAALRERERQLAESQRIAHIGSWQHNLTTNEVIWSDELFRVLGLDPEKDPGDFNMFFSMIHPDDQPVLKKAITESIETGKHFSVEYRFIFRDGRTRIIHAQAELITDETGTQKILSGTGQDITERKKAEDALKESQKLIETIVELTPT